MEEELDAVESIDELDEQIQQFVTAINEETDTTLRMAIHFSGDDITQLFVREDVAKANTDTELTEKARALALKGISDPPRDQHAENGTLDATVRWYSEVVLTCFPLRDWSGLVFAFDREASPVIDLAHDLLD